MGGMFFLRQGTDDYVLTNNVYTDLRGKTYI